MVRWLVASSVQTFLTGSHRSSFFLIGFYSLALACLALILKFGVLEAVNPPNDKIQGVFVLACVVAGIAGGGIAIFFWQQAKYFIGGWGGFAIGLWVQCFRDGGLIRPIGFRWILYIGKSRLNEYGIKLLMTATQYLLISGLGVAGFCLCTLPKLHYHVLLASTAAVGASAFVLGIDCFTTAGLKEVSWPSVLCAFLAHHAEPLLVLRLESWL